MTYSFNSFDTKTAASSASMMDNILNAMQSSGTSSKSRNGSDFDATFMSEFKDVQKSSATYDDSSIKDNKFFSADNRTSIQNNSNDEYNTVKRQNEDRHRSSSYEERNDDSREDDSLKEKSLHESKEHESDSSSKNESVERHDTHKKDDSGEEHREKTVQERSQAAVSETHSEKETPKDHTSDKSSDKKTVAVAATEQQQSHSLASVAGSKEFKAVLESLNLQAGMLSASLRKSGTSKASATADSETADQAKSKTESGKTVRKHSVSVNAGALANQVQTQSAAASAKESGTKEKSGNAKQVADAVKSASGTDALAAAMAQHMKSESTDHKKAHSSATSATVVQNQADSSNAKQGKTDGLQKQTENKLSKNDSVQTASSKKISQLESEDVKIQSVKIETVEAEKTKTQNSASESDAGRLLKSLESKNPELNSKLLARNGAEHNNGSDKGSSHRESHSDSDLKQDLQNAVKTAVKDITNSVSTNAQTQVKAPDFHTGMQNNNPAPDAKIQAQNNVHTQNSSDGMPSNLKNINVVQEIMGRIQNTVKGSGYESGMKMTMDIQSGSLGNIQLSLQHSADSIKVSLQSGDDSAKDFLMNQRREMEQQLKDMGFNHVNVDISSRDSDSQNQNRQFYNSLGNEDLENVKLAGNDQADLADLLAATV